MKPRDLLERIRHPFGSSRRESAASARREEEDLEAIAAREQRAFRYETLAAATRNFSEKQKLGQGGFGPVYRGRLPVPDGREVAVKRLGAGSRQGAREFKNEANLLSRVQHRNVVNLLGYCAHGADEKLLVYEYVPNESLDKILFSAAAPPRSGGSSSSDGDRPVRAELTWPRRLEVVVGVARGLLYLHEDAHTPIIHRDIKASNILLDERWVAKIADFGMARLFPEAGDGRSHVQTRVAGTNGYMAPEYLMHGHLSAKADVFSFGVLVLEILSGRKNSSFIPPPRSSADNLLDYVRVEAVQGGAEHGAAGPVGEGDGRAGAGAHVRPHRAAVRAGGPAAAAGHEARGDHPLQEAEHAGGADAARGARVALPEEGARPAQLLAVLRRVVVGHDPLDVACVGVGIGVGVGVERDDDVEHAHPEEPRPPVAPGRAGAAQRQLKPEADCTYVHSFSSCFFSCLLGDSRVDSMIILAVGREK
ncbi:cysteine-rich receptor-like protein kinase 25 isoform X1 [Hordeum vulgare subsp. vulgare]|uniref:non-specific serine/threonine protein kinase n=1 Tax=Hordeum vulgare subsp. vulgare TaxID=112509 RepID=A0A8I6YDC2_HORVV|nr:cysteine-rich receptor-like protein kinase 25 isoform X1 [Hordeum vulgare subsp. vulgare]